MTLWKEWGLEGKCYFTEKCYENVKWVTWQLSGGNTLIYTCLSV